MAPTSRSFALPSLPGGLRAKILASAFVPTAIILLAVALTTYMAYRDVTEVLVMERNQELARLFANQIAAELSGYRERLTAEARTVDLASPDAAALQDTLDQARNRLFVFDGGLLVLDHFGRLVGASPPRPEALGQDWSDREWVRRMLLSSAPIYSDIEHNEPDGADTILAAVPISGPRGEFQGVLAGLFRVHSSTISTFYGDMVKLRLSRSGSAYLVDGRGQVIYHSNGDRIAEDFSGQPVVGQVLTGSAGALRTRNLSDAPIVAAYAPVPGTAWGLVIEERWDVLSNASEDYRRFLALLLVLGVVVPTVYVAVAVQRITRPVEKLIAAAKEMAGGNLAQTIQVQTNDEIAELARQFNHMSSQLQASYAEMEQKVADRTRELSALNDVAQALSHSLELDALLSVALETVLDVLGFETGVIYLHNQRTGELEVVRERGVPDSDLYSATRGTLSTRAAQSGQPIIIDDLAQEPNAPAGLVEAGYRSVASFPLIAKRQVQGVLSAATRRHHPFRSQDIDLLTSIGHQIGVAIENAQLYQAEQRRAEQFRVIGEMGRSIASILVVDNLLHHMIRLLYEGFHYYHVGIGLIEDDYVVFKAGAGTLWEETDFQITPDRLALGIQGLSGWVAATGEPLLVPDVSQEPRYLAMAGSATRSELVVPIKVKDTVIGVLDVQQDQVDAFDPIDLAVLQSLANQAGVAIENARLYEQARQLAVLEERQRLARDLHDSVTQALYGVTLYAEAAARLLETGNQATATEHLRHLRDTAQEALGEMRLLIYELRPSILAEEGLVAALQSRLDTVEARAGVSATFKAEGLGKLPGEIEEGLYWICQETLNNALKHARARHVSVTICGRESPPGIALEIGDDGIGFDLVAGRAEGGLGLRGMEERATLMGGTLHVESAPGAGTRIRVEVLL